MTSPEAKYGLKKQLEFFNNHEYLINEYQPVEGTDPKLQSLVINHFPNVYTTKGSHIYKTTRIVRIPRVFDTIQFPDLIPQFSTIIPGTEPAAITKNGQTNFEVAGYFDDSAFGVSSMTILSKYDSSELIEIIRNINSYLFTAYNPYSLRNALESMAEIVTGSIYSRLFTMSSKAHLQDLEKYVEDVNQTHEYSIILPRVSGYLSLDIQVPFTNGSAI